MAEDNSDWSTNSNDAINISLVTSELGAVKTIASFKPEFTYALFGEEESIFGYQGLKINLRYNASDMRPNVQITYNKKFKAVNETAAQDLKPTLQQFLPDRAFDKTTIFDQIINENKISEIFEPPGKLEQAYDEGDSHFEIRRGVLGQPEIESMLKRMQILVPFFIDGGTFIDLEDPFKKRWTIFFLYEVKKDASGAPSQYIFMGYATVFRYHPHGNFTVKLLENREGKEKKKKLADFTLPIAKPKGFLCRPRISQFIILPPFQKGGHGSRLYSSIYTHYLSTTNVIEITVEDPNEDFDYLRDINDLAYLRSRSDFSEITIDPQVKINKNRKFPLNKLIDQDSLDRIRVATKIAPRQFARLVEMHLLSKIPIHIRRSLVFVQEKDKDIKDAAEEKKRKYIYRLWQLMVKSRLYRHNRDVLMQIDRLERADKLDAALASVEESYVKVLSAVERKIAKDKAKELVKEVEVPVEGEGAGEGEGEKSHKANGKRAADTDMEGEPAAKKSKLDTSIPKNTKSGGEEASGEQNKDVEMGDANA